MYRKKSMEWIGHLSNLSLPKCRLGYGKTLIVDQPQKVVRDLSEHGLSVLAANKGGLVSLSNKAEYKQAECDFCYNRKSRNAKIVHQLKMSEQDFRDHLKSLYGKAGDDDGWIASRLTWHRFVWKYYGQKAREEHKPIWQAYLEAHGIKVKRAAGPAWASLPEKVPF